MIDPQLLYSDDAEKAVLGSMLAQPQEVIGKTLEILMRDDFFVPAHREVFTALATMHEREAIDVMTVHQWFVDRKLDKPVGSPGILGDLLSGFATHLNVGAYIKIVKDKSLLRSMQAACVAIVKDIQEMPDAVPEVLDRAEAAIFKVTRQGLTNKSNILTARQCVAKYRVHRENVEIGEVRPRIPTGIYAIDNGNGGLLSPGYVVLAGEQGSGKSALLLAILRNCCMEGIGVGGFSLEMTEEQLINRLVSEKTTINSRRFAGKMNDREQALTDCALSEIEQWNFHIDPTSGLRPMDIRKGTRRMVEAGCKLIWLDNAQLMTGSNERDRRNEQLTEVSRTIQDVQKEYGVTFILACQVTRTAQKGKNGFSLFDLADCAAFERDARVVIFLENTEAGENAPDSAIPIVVNIAKYSEGKTGRENAVFNKCEQRIV